MYPDEILIRGAKEHNLKNIDVRLPRFKLVVITGVSGSGKSSLAFDTLYAEGQRRYVESLSAYARQFIGQMEKPRVDFIGGLSPAIAIEQKAVSRNPRSTVATVTEIYDYLRVLFARVGTPHCPQCGREVRAQSAQEIVEQVAALPASTRFQVLAPLARNRKGTFKDTFTKARADGFARVRVDGEPAYMMVMQNPSFVWGDIGGEIRDGYGKLLYKAEIVVMSSGHTLPFGSDMVVAEFEPDPYEEIDEAADTPTFARVTFSPPAPIVPLAAATGYELYDDWDDFE